MHSVCAAAAGSAKSRLSTTSQEIAIDTREQIVEEAASARVRNVPQLVAGRGIIGAWAACEAGICSTRQTRQQHHPAVAHRPHGVGVVCSSPHGWLAGVAHAPLLARAARPLTVWGGCTRAALHPRAVLAHCPGRGGASGGHAVDVAGEPVWGRFRRGAGGRILRPRRVGRGHGTGSAAPCACRRQCGRPAQHTSTDAAAPPHPPSSTPHDTPWAQTRW
jgi:hypothetical protein